MNRARAEMDDDERARHERLLKEQTDLQRALEQSRERVGVDPEDLHSVAAAALSRAGYDLDDARARQSATSKPYGSIPLILPSQKMQVGKMLSTIYGFVHESVASASGTGGAMRPSVRSHSSRPS